jgi:hypothetical protein
LPSRFGDGRRDVKRWSIRSRRLRTSQTERVALDLGFELRVARVGAEVAEPEFPIGVVEGGGGRHAPAADKREIEASASWR